VERASLPVPGRARMCRSCFRAKTR
jgi:hypothetical protein